MSYVNGVLEKALRAETEVIERLKPILDDNHKALLKARQKVDDTQTMIENAEANIVEIQIAMGTYPESIYKSMAKQEKAPCVSMKKG